MRNVSIPFLCASICLTTMSLIGTKVAGQAQSRKAWPIDPGIVMGNECRHPVIRVSDLTEEQLRQRANKIVEPVLPQEIKEGQVKVTIIADLQIDKNGQVRRVEVFNTQNSVIKKAVADAVRQWTFKPFIICDELTPAEGRLIFHYVIKDKGVVEEGKTEEF